MTKLGSVLNQKFCPLRKAGIQRISRWDGNIERLKKEPQQTHHQAIKSKIQDKWYRNKNVSNGISVYDAKKGAFEKNTQEVQKKNC